MTRLCSNKRFLVESRCRLSLERRTDGAVTTCWPVKFYLTIFVHINTNMVQMPRVIRDEATAGPILQRWFNFDQDDS